MLTVATIFKNLRDFPNNSTSSFSFIYLLTYAFHHLLIVDHELFNCSTILFINQFRHEEHERKENNESRNISDDNKNEKKALPSVSLLPVQSSVQPFPWLTG